MSNAEPGKVIASAFALAGFAVAMVAGSTSGNPATTVLKTGIIAMVLCYAAGMCIGAIAQGVIKQHLDGPHQAVVPVQPASSPSGGASDIGRSAEATS